MNASLPAEVREDLEGGQRESGAKNCAVALPASQAEAPLDALVDAIKTGSAEKLLDRLDQIEAPLNDAQTTEQNELRSLIELGHLLRQQDDHEKAASAFRAAAAIDPGNKDIQVELARDLRALHRLNEAETVLKNILDAEPQSTWALVERGLILRQQGKHEEATTAFKAAATSETDNRNIQVEVARSLRALHRIDEADRTLKSVLLADPLHLGALIERGHLLFERGNKIGALATFVAAATIEPEHTELQFDAANILRSLGRFADAEKILRKLAAAAPNSLPTIVALSHLLMDANRFDEAESTLNQATDAHPDNLQIMAALGQLARRRGDAAAALRYFSSVYKQDPANLDARLELAAQLREQGDFDGAVQLVQSVLDANPDHWDGWMQLGQLCRAKRDPEGAMNAFRTSVTKQPQRPEGFVELAHETWAAGQPKEAEQFLQKALALEPQHPSALLASAEFALQSERPREALRLAQSAILFHPGALDPYLLAARAAAQALEREQALNILEQAREIFGSPPEVNAMHIHVLRHFRDFSAAQSLIAESRTQIAGNFSLWLEGTSFAIAVGDFETAERALALAPTTPKALAYIHLMQAQIAEGRRHYQQAIAHYHDALAVDPNNGSLHSELARTLLLRADTSGARSHLRTAFEHDKARRISADHSLNVSQHHTGQLINEFVLVPALLRRLKQVVPLPAAQQIEPLKQLVREYPAYTPPALLLMLAMRTSEVFSKFQIASRVDAPKIPRRIVQYWHSRDLPHDISALMKSWSNAHDDYEHIVFDDETADNFLRANYRDEIHRTFRRARDPSQRADILRLAYLASEGGYFIDADDKCLARLDTLVPTQADFAGYQDHHGAIGSDFIGTIPGHPVIALALENALSAANRGDRDIIWLSTGAGLLTRAFTQVLSLAETDWLSKVRLLELWELQRIAGIYCPARYKRPDLFNAPLSTDVEKAKSATGLKLRPSISKIEVTRK